MAALGQFAQDLAGCGAIITAGACVGMAVLPNCATEGIEYTLTVETGGGAAIGGTAITVSATSTDANAASEINLTKGNLITFSGGAVAKLTANARLDTDGVDTAVLAVEPLEVAVADAETAVTWAVMYVVAPTDIPLTSNDTLVDTTDTKGGLQGSEQKTNIMLDTTVQLILRPDDPAMCFFHDSSQQDVEVLVAIALNGGIYAVGRAIICNIQYPNPVKEVIRPQFQIKFQPPYDFVNTSCWDFNVPADLVKIQTLNANLRLAGLPELPEA